MQYHRLLPVLMASLVLNGCSSTPQAKPLPPLETFAIVSSAATKKDLEANSTSGKAAVGIG
ncbi:MAG: hypothetical protein HC809_17145, partial [Gammaproteobacteria bacterium]|nr:hypothetical protein [Gammaproteobacteria bacterium]